MSVILRDVQTKKILLYCKGADNFILLRMKTDLSKLKIDTINKHLTDYANTGLRTLVVGEKVISEEDYEKWSKTYADAKG